MAYPPTLPPDTRTDSTVAAGNHAQDHNKIVAAIRDLLEVLGADPAGSYADLTNRLLGVAAGQDQAAIDAFTALRDEAQTARDLAVDISNIDVTDDAIDVAVRLPGSKAAGAIGTTVGVAKFSVTDAGLFVSKDGADTNDGLSPGKAKATVGAALAALPSGKGTVTLGRGVFTEKNLPLTTGLVLRGIPGASQITAVGGDALVTPAGVANLVLDGLIVAASGSCIRSQLGTYLSLSRFRNLHLIQTSGTAPAIDAAGLVDTKWDVEVTGANAATVPLVRLIAQGSHAVACNMFTGRVNFRANQYAFHIEDATGNSYAANNRITGVNFEQTYGGAVKVLTGYANVIDGIGIYDLVESAIAPLVYFGKSAASALLSRRNRLATYHRAGGSLAAGVYDVALQNAGATGTTLVDCDATSGFRVDWGSTAAIAVNTGVGVGAVGSAAVSGAGVTGIKLPVAARGNWHTPAVAGAGVQFFDLTSNKVLTSDGTNWRDGAGTIVT